jgi:hypothetical protein
MIRSRCRLWTLLLALSGVACAEPETYRWRESMPDGIKFIEEVMPVLIRDCGFQTCHGSSERFFQVYGPGRSRLDPLTPVFSVQTGKELELSYNLAVSMIDSERPGRSLLLRKPLAVKAGGAGHRGTDRYGRDVYRTTNDPGYLTLARWVFAVAPAPPPPPMMNPPMAGMQAPPTAGMQAPPPAGMQAPPVAGTQAPPPGVPNGGE